MITAISLVTIAAKNLVNTPAAIASPLAHSTKIRK
jgi:hypothetical protein